MRKIYVNPTVDVVELNGGAICQSLVIGSAGSEGDGDDLVKEDRNNRGDIWSDVSTTPVQWDE